MNRFFMAKTQEPLLLQGCLWELLTNWTMGRYTLDVWKTVNFIVMEGDRTGMGNRRQDDLVSYCRLREYRKYGEIGSNEREISGRW